MVMKTKINQQASKSKNFENKIAKLLPVNVKEIEIQEVYWKRVSYGEYYIILDVVINGNEITLRSRTNDSQGFDAFRELEIGTKKYENYQKREILGFIENNYYKFLEIA